MRIILAIHPEFASLIMDGYKKYELRRRFPLEATEVLLYATTPVCKVVGSFRVGQIHTMATERLYNFLGGAKETKLLPKDYYRYFYKQEFATGVEVLSPEKFPEPLSLSHFGIKYPPQSWCYVTKLKSTPTKRAKLAKQLEGYLFE